MTLIDHNFLGLNSMKRCGINTKAQKSLVLKYASERFNASFVEALDTILVPQYLGWEVPDFLRIGKSQKTIAFNHRPHEYKSYPWFLEQMDKLWETRQDFRVWVPLAEAADRPYIEIGMNKTRYEYLSHLSGCCFGVCGRQKYAGWSVSATDGLSVEVPYIFANEDYYKELAGQAGLYFDTDEEFLSNCRMLLDNPHLRLEYSKRGIERFHECEWDKAIEPINDMFQSTFDTLPIMSGKTDAFDRIVQYIRQNKSVSKKDIMDYLGWGVRIPWSPYRNMLRNEKNIVFTKNRYEYKDEEKQKLTS
jgi:hypothetical protein